MGVRPGNRGAAFGPATVRNLRGQSSRLGKRVDLAPEGNVVGSGPRVVEASGSSENAGVGSHVGVGKGIPAALSPAPHETVRRISRLLSPHGRHEIGLPGTAFGPATVHRLRGQSSRFEERMDRTHEVTFVGRVPGEDGAAGSSLELDVRRHLGVGRGIEVAPPRRPWAKGHGEAAHCSRKWDNRRRTAKRNTSERWVHPISWMPPTVNKVCCRLRPPGGGLRPNRPEC